MLLKFGQSNLNAAFRFISGILNFVPFQVLLGPHFIGSLFSRASIMRNCLVGVAPINVHLWCFCTL